MRVKETESAAESGKKLPPLPPNVVRRPKGTILDIVVMVAGKRRKKSAKTSDPKLASQYAQAWKQELQKEQFMLAQLTPEQRERLDRGKRLKPSPTFGAFVRPPDPSKGFAGGEFWTEYATNQYNQPSQKGTLRFYRMRILEMLKYESLAECPLHQIDEKVTTSYINYRRSLPGRKLETTLKQGTINKDIAALSHILKQARVQKYLDVRPELPQRKKTNTPGIAMQEVEEKVYFVLPMPQDLRDWVTIMLHTGLEPGATAKLRWNHDVRLHRDTAVHGRSTKTIDRAQVQPIQDVLSNVLRERWMRKGKPTEGFVFPSSKTAGPNDPTRFWNLHDQHMDAIRKLFPNFRPFRPYDFRHTFATRRWAEHKDALRLKKEMRWKTLKQLETYVHLYEDDVIIPDEQKMLAFLEHMKAWPVEQTS